MSNLLYVGHDGSGMLLATNSGHVNAAALVIGQFASAHGEATLDGTNAAWIVTNNLTLANGSQLQFQDPTYLYYVTSSPQSYSAVSGGSTLWNSADYSYFGPYGWYIARIPPSPVPEIDPTGMGSVVALLAGAFGLLERCRLKVKLAV